MRGSRANRVSQNASQRSNLRLPHSATKLLPAAWLHTKLHLPHHQRPNPLQSRVHPLSIVMKCESCVTCHTDPKTHRLSRGQAQPEWGKVQTRQNAWKARRTASAQYRNMKLKSLVVRKWVGVTRTPFLPTVGGPGSSCLLLPEACRNEQNEEGATDPDNTTMERTRQNATRLVPIT